jgi:uncharacterized protein YjiS (DUF1127 family)
MKTTVYFPKLASLVGLTRHFARTRNTNARLLDLDLTSHLLRDIGLRQAPDGPDGRNFLPF